MDPGFQKVGGSGLKRLGTGSCNFPTTAANVRLADEIDMGAENFKLPQNCGFTLGFSGASFVFSGENFPTRRTFSDSLKIRGGGGSCPLPPLTRRYRLGEGRSLPVPITVAPMAQWLLLVTTNTAAAGAGP